MGRRKEVEKGMKKKKTFRVIRKTTRLDKVRISVLIQLRNQKNLGSWCFLEIKGSKVSLERWDGLMKGALPDKCEVFTTPVLLTRTSSRSGNMGRGVGWWKGVPITRLRKKYE